MPNSWRLIIASLPLFPPRCQIDPHSFQCVSLSRNTPKRSGGGTSLLRWDDVSSKVLLPLSMSGRNISFLFLLSNRGGLVPQRSMCQALRLNDTEEARGTILTTTALPLCKLLSEQMLFKVSLSPADRSGEFFLLLSQLNFGFLTSKYGFLLQR